MNEMLILMDMAQNLLGGGEWVAAIPFMLNGEPDLPDPPHSFVDPVTGAPVPPPGAGPDPFDLSLDDFRAALERSRGIFGGAIGGIGNIAGQFGQLAEGFDPVLDAQRDRALNASRQGLARRGLAGSSISANESARINQGFVEQGLNQRRADLGAQAGLLGQQTGLSEQAANLELAIPSILTAQTAAENAGQGGGKK